MTTIVNNPKPSNDSSGMGMIVGLILLIVLIYLGYVYGLPMIKQSQSGGTQINVPSKIDVNINQTSE